SCSCPPPPELYTPSLLDALPISRPLCPPGPALARVCADAAQTGRGWVAGTRRQPHHDRLRNGHRRTLSLAARKHAVDHDVVAGRSEEHTSELQSRFDLVCRLLLE